MDEFSTSGIIGSHTKDSEIAEGVLSSTRFDGRVGTLSINEDIHNYPKDYTRKKQGEDDRTPISCIAIEYNIPIQLVKCLIGKTEEETADNIYMLKRWVEKLLNDRKE